MFGCGTSEIDLDYRLDYRLGVFGGEGLDCELAVDA